MISTHSSLIRGHGFESPWIRRPLCASSPLEYRFTFVICFTSQSKIFQHESEFTRAPIRIPNTKNEIIQEEDDNVHCYLIINYIHCTDVMPYEKRKPMLIHLLQDLYMLSIYSTGSMMVNIYSHLIFILKLY